MADTVLIEVVERASEFVQLFLGDTLKRKHRKGLGQNKCNEETRFYNARVFEKKKKKDYARVQWSFACLEVNIRPHESAISATIH